MILQLYGNNLGQKGSLEFSCPTSDPSGIHIQSCGLRLSPADKLLKMSLSRFHTLQEPVPSLMMEKVFPLSQNCLSWKRPLKAIWSDSPTTSRDIYSSIGFSEHTPSTWHAPHLWATRSPEISLPAACTLCLSSFQCAPHRKTGFFFPAASH